MFLLKLRFIVIVVIVYFPMLLLTAFAVVEPAIDTTPTQPTCPTPTHTLMLVAREKELRNRR